MAMSELQEPIIASFKAYLATGNFERLIELFQPFVRINIYLSYLAYYLHISAASKTAEAVLQGLVKRSVGQGVWPKHTRRKNVKVTNYSIANLNVYYHHLTQSKQSRNKTTRARA